MKIYRQTIIFFVVVSFILLCGCWDNVEINKRAFVMGMGLDSSDDDKNMNITYEIILPSKVIKGGEGGSSGESKPGSWIITKKTDMILKAQYSIHENIDRQIDLDHLQIVIIGAKKGAKGLQKDMDFFIRYPNMRKRTNVVFINGKASDVFEIIPKTINSPSLFISGLLESNRRYLHIATISSELYNVIQNVTDGFDFIIPEIKIVNNQVKIEGGAAFKDGKYITHIEQDEIHTIQWMGDKIRSLEVEIADPQNPSKNIIYNITDGNSKLEPIFDGNNVNFNLYLNLEGDIGEMEDIAFLGATDVKYLEQAEIMLKNKIEEEIKNIFDKYVKQKNLDIFGLKRKIKNNNLEFYDKNIQLMDEIIAQSNIRINSNIKIRRLGLAD